MAKWIEDNLGWGPIVGISLALIFIFYFLMYRTFPALSSQPAAVILGIEVGMPLTLFGFSLLWVVYPLMSRGPVRLEPLAQKAAYLSVALGLGILFFSVLGGLVAASLR